MQYTDEIYETAAVLKGGCSEALRTYCAIAEAEVMGRLRGSVSVSDFYEVFIGACAILAVAMDGECGYLSEAGSFKAGEVSVTRGGEAAAAAPALRKQAEALLAPYIYDDGFAFTGVAEG